MFSSILNSDTMNIFQHLKAHLLMYRPHDAEERCTLRFFEQFLDEFGLKAFDRTNTIGHIVGSAFLVNEDCSRIALMQHKKLNMWLQPGGHTDNDRTILCTAMRELEEEFSIPVKESIFASLDCFSNKHTRLFMKQDIFDLELQVFPEKPEFPQHWHLDVRYLFFSREQIFEGNDESTDIRWFDVESVIIGRDNNASNRVKQKLLDYRQSLSK